MMELGRPTLRRHHHRAHREPTPPAETPTKTSSFSFILYFTVLCKIHLYLNEIYVVFQILSSLKFGMGGTAGKPPPPIPKSALPPPHKKGLKIACAGSRLGGGEWRCFESLRYLGTYVNALKARRTSEVLTEAGFLFTFIHCTR
jgi:hypothetical protein